MRQAPLPVAKVQQAVLALIKQGRFEGAAELFIREATGVQATPARLASLMRWLADWERQTLQWGLDIGPALDMGSAMESGFRALFASDQGERERTHLIALFDAASREPGFPLSPRFHESPSLGLLPSVPRAWQKAAEALLQTPRAQQAWDAKSSRVERRQEPVLPALVEELLACTGGASSVTEIAKAWAWAHPVFPNAESRERSFRYVCQQAIAAGADGAALRASAAILAGVTRPDSALQERTDCDTFQPWLDDGFTEADPEIRKHLWPALLHACKWDARSMDRVLDRVLEGSGAAVGEDDVSAARRQGAACVDLGFAIGSSGSKAATESLIDRLGTAIRKSPLVLPAQREALERGLKLGFHAGQHPDGELLSRARVRLSSHHDPRSRLVSMFGAHCRNPEASANFMRGVVRSALPAAEKLHLIHGFMQVAGSRLGPAALRHAREALVEALDAAGPMALRAPSDESSRSTMAAAGDSRSTDGMYADALIAFYLGYAQALDRPAGRLAWFRSQAAHGMPGRAVALGVLGSHLALHATGVAQELGWLEGITQPLRRIDLGTESAARVLHQLKGTLRVAIGPSADWPAWLPGVEDATGTSQPVDRLDSKYSDIPSVASSAAPAGPALAPSSAGPGPGKVPPPSGIPAAPARK